MDFASNLSIVESRIIRACDLAGRSRNDVRLVAVSKMHGAERIREAHAAGQRHFGENYAQELEEKAEVLADLPDIVWHFIGNLQTNKAKVVAKYAHYIHTVDRVELARELAKRLSTYNRTMGVLLEVNVSGEPQKHGCDPSSVEALANEVRTHTPLELLGLMTVPPDDDVRTERAFSDLAALAKKHDLRELSMGMSQDLEAAITHGATMIRIGTALFGEREKRVAGA